ncbi:MAG: glycosyltransferase [Acidobacteriota bacterium]
MPTIGRPQLQACLAALARQTRRPDEIIVVHDEHRRGSAWARNEGIRRSHGDLIAFTDDDCLPPPDWLERLVLALKRFNAATAGGMFTEEDPLLQDLRRLRRYPIEDAIDTTGFVGSGGSVLYRREWLERCAAEDGYVFNEAFHVSQDWELAWRLRRRGAIAAFTPVSVLHRRRVTGSSFIRMQFRRGVGIAMLFRLQGIDPDAPPIHSSLLWGSHGQRHQPHWARAVWSKLTAGVASGRFSRSAHRWWFWLGEQCQAAGFLWGLVRRHPLRPPGDES